MSTTPLCQPDSRRCGPDRAPRRSTSHPAGARCAVRAASGGRRAERRRGGAAATAAARAAATRGAAGHAAASGRSSVRTPGCAVRRARPTDRPMRTFRTFARSCLASTSDHGSVTRRASRSPSGALPDRRSGRHLWHDIAGAPPERAGPWRPRCVCGTAALAVTGGALVLVDGAPTARARHDGVVAAPRRTRRRPSGRACDRRAARRRRRRPRQGRAAGRTAGPASRPGSRARPAATAASTPPASARSSRTCARRRGSSAASSASRRCTGWPGARACRTIRRGAPSTSWSTAPPATARRLRPEQPRGAGHHLRDLAAADQLRQRLAAHGRPRRRDGQPLRPRARLIWRVGGRAHKRVRSRSR